MQVTEIDKRLAALAEDKESLNAELNELLALDEDFDEKEQARADEIQKELAKLEKKVALNESLRKDASEQQRPKPANKPNAETPISVKPAWESHEAFGYERPMDFFADVIRDGTPDRPEASRNERLRFLATAGSDEQMTSNDQYGGYSVPSVLLSQLLSINPEMDPLSGTTKIPMEVPTVKLLARTDKNHSTSVSGGFTFSRTHETQQISSSRGQIETVTLDANDLSGLCYATNSVLSDSILSYAAIIQQGFGQQYMHHMIGEKIRGTGTGEYEGILNSPALVTVTRGVTDKFLGSDAVNMMSRCWNYDNAVWIVNHDVIPQLASCTLGGDPAGTGTPIDSVPIFHPGNGTGLPPTLLNRPVYFSEYCSTLATVGDVLLIVPSEYLEGEYQSLQGASSVHVRFDRNESVFRYTARNDGRGWWRSALTPNQGANTLSPFVACSTDT